MTDQVGYGAIFDLDGVIADTGPSHYHAWQQVAREYDFPMSEETFRNSFGTQNEHVIPLLYGRPVPEDLVREISLRKEALYREVVASELQACNGFEALLDDLHTHGFVLALGSSAPGANVDLVLNTLGIKSRFETLITGDEITNSKPAPDTFLQAAKKLNLPPNRCLVFEDAVQGVEAAHRAGMPVIAVTTTRAREDLKTAECVVDSLTEIDADQVCGLIDVRDNGI